MKYIFVLLLFFLPFVDTAKYHLTRITRFSQQISFTTSEQGKEIPVLCFHNIKPRPTRENLLTISEAHFHAQIKFLYDKGYHSVLPDELYQHFTAGTPLPPNPIMLSFDDSHEEDFSIARPVLEKYGFKAVFFVMTICLNKPHYLTSAQLKELSDEGHAIENHTWDHRKVTSFRSADWKKEIDGPTSRLEKITGKRVEFFAYPYGVWDASAIAELKRHHIKAAFQLTGKSGEADSLFTIRRMMVSGLWSPDELGQQIHNKFPG